MIQKKKGIKLLPLAGENSSLQHETYDRNGSTFVTVYTSQRQVRKTDVNLKTQTQDNAGKIWQTGK
jgi:hypothetical protein